MSARANVTAFIESKGDQIQCFSVPMPYCGCWIWLGAVDKHGYGRVRMKKKAIGAHRLSYAIKFGDVPPELHVCHHCDTPACVNPDHLFLGTQLENIRDCVEKKRNKPRPFKKGWDNPRAMRILNEGQVREIMSMKDSRLTAQELRRRFGVHHQTCRDIWNKRRWKHLWQ